MSDKEVCKVLNKFLKGINMGITAYKDFIERALSKELIESLTEVYDNFQSHKGLIERRIEEHMGSPKEYLGIVGLLSEFYEKIKLLSASDDGEILENAIEALNMGIKNSNKFLEENEKLDEDIKKEIKGIINDYEESLRKLESLSLEMD